jgi:hypothetical protein
VGSKDIAARRRARAAWPVARFRLHDEPSDNLSDATTASERIAMMWPLATEAWALSGRLLPIYARIATPSRIFRPGEKVPDDDDDRWSE